MVSLEYREPKGIGDVVDRQVGPKQVRPCLVTGWYPSSTQATHYVLTPIPLGMTSADFGVKFWAATIDELPATKKEVPHCKHCGSAQPI